MKDLAIYLSGMSLGLSLIVAIGAQNVFVLRQGLLRVHVLAVCLTCAVSDAILIGVGVSGFGAAVKAFPWIHPVLLYGGAAFLAWYGWKSLRSALHSSGAIVAGTSRIDASLKKTLAACLAITWLNPHVYLDTVVLLGTVSAQFSGAKAAFAAGAMSGSFLFFFALGYGARFLRPILAKPGAWRVMEGAIALVMWGMALKLLVP